MTRTVIASMPCPTEDIDTHPPNCEKLKEETQHDAKLLHRLCSRLYLKRLQEPTPFSPDRKQRPLPAKAVKAAKASEAAESKASRKATGRLSAKAAKAAKASEAAEAKASSRRAPWLRAKP